MAKKTKKSLLKGILWLFFVSWWIWIVYLVKAIVKAVKKSPHPPTVTRTTPSNAARSFEVAGVAYRVDKLIELGDPSRNYDWSDEKILEKFGEGQRLYKYFFRGLKGDLVPDPENPHDPNAIRVELEGVLIGYVPAELCVDVKKLLDLGYRPQINVRGGPVKWVEGGKVYEEDKKLHVYVDMVQ